MLPLSVLTLLACAGSGTAPLPATLVAAASECPVRPYWPTNGWLSKAPEWSGIDTADLKLAERFVGDSMPNLYSLVVVQHGYVVVEEYWHGADSLTPFDLRSATKSVTATVVGEELWQRDLKSVDQRVAEFFPDYFRNQGPDSWKWRIRLRHLLTMTAGFEWAEGTGIHVPADAPETTFIALPMAKIPGTKFNYNSGGIHLLSIILSRTTGQSLRELANATVFRPIGLEVPLERWDADPLGHSYGGYGLWLTAREMARFGYLYLNDGCWEDRRVLPPGWVEEATAPHVDTPFGKGTYGYLWWRTTFDGHPAYFAGGWGGQHVVVVPELDLVIVTTAVPEPTSITTDPLRMVRRFVVPAAEGIAALQG